MSGPHLHVVASEVAATLKINDVSFYRGGASKETYRGVAVGGGPVALKVVNRDKIDEERTDREIAALKRCCTPRVAKLFERVIFQASDGKTYDVVVEEFLGGGCLSDLLPTMPLDEVRRIALELATALGEIFPLRLVHRDIKPANVMFRESGNIPVLVDFGLVRDLAESSLTMTWLPSGPGTRFYSPPEQLLNEKNLIDWRSDQFALGVLVAERLFGRHPYQDEGMTPQEAIRSVAQRSPLPASFLRCARDADFQFLERMLSAWPASRFRQPQQLIAAI